MAVLYVYVHDNIRFCDFCILGNSLSVCLKLSWVFQLLLVLRARARLDGATCTLQYFHISGFGYSDFLNNLVM